MSEPSINKRIAKNTLLLYFRLILIMLVSLYTVRVVLRVLGVEDYGVYNVVAGIVTMFGFLSGSMATASQRFFSFELGKEDYDKLQKTFCMSMNIYLFIALIVLVFAETVGLWFVQHKLVIPLSRTGASFWMYQFSILTFLVTLVTTPYMAVIIARENMDVYAYVSILEAILKLAVVFFLQLLPFDKLVVYGILLLCVQVIVSSVYILVCRKRYRESRFSRYWDISLFKTLFSYTGWNLFGSSASVVKNQGVNILLNIYFGPAVNAARAIASQISSAVMSFSQNFSTAVRPQIIKLYASGDRERMLKLVFQSSKMTAFLMFLFVLPLYLEMPEILKLWLGQVPDYVVVFARLVLIDILVDSISYPLMTAAQATGKIKLYQGVVGGILLLNLPVAWLALKFGLPPESVMYAAIAITFFAFIVRLLIIRRLIEFSIWAYIRSTVVPVVVSVFVSTGLSIFVVRYSEQRNVYFLFSLGITVALVLVSTYIFGFSNGERKRCREMIASKLSGNKNINL